MTIQLQLTKRGDANVRTIYFKYSLFCPLFKCYVSSGTLPNHSRQVEFPPPKIKTFLFFSLLGGEAYVIKLTMQLLDFLSKTLSRPVIESLFYYETI